MNADVLSLAAAALAAGLGLVLLVRSGLGLDRAVRPIDEPACPRCRYRLAGVAGAACPECGHDLERGGVVDRRDPARTPLLLARACLVLLAAGFLVPHAHRGVEALRPPTWKLEQQATLRGPGSDPSGSRLEIVRHAFARGHGTPSPGELGPGEVIVRRSGTPDVELLRAASTELAGREPAAVAAALRRALPGDEAVPVDGAAMVAVALARAAVDGAAIDVRGLAERAAGEARVSPGRRMRAAGGTSRLRSWRPPARWPRPVATAVVGGAAALAIGWLVRDHRRRRPVPWSVAGPRATPPGTRPGDPASDAAAGPPDEPVS